MAVPYHIIRFMSGIILYAVLLSRTFTGIAPKRTKQYFVELYNRRCELKSVAEPEEGETGLSLPQRRFEPPLGKNVLVTHSIW